MMHPNEVLRRIRYIFDYDDVTMIRLFGLGGEAVTRAQVSDWLKRDDSDSFREMSEKLLATFLNGLIIDKRGKRDGELPVAESEMDNNLVLKKMKIALALKTDDIVKLFKAQGKNISEHELSAFLRNPKQSQYREFQDQYIRVFLDGLKNKHRGKKDTAPKKPVNFVRGSRGQG